MSLLIGPMAIGQTMVYLENAETLSFDESLHPDAQILRGNVQFRHEDALMYCDSAYFYEKSNSIDAFGHVRFVQGDTLFGYGDVLHYDGNTKFARLRRHVKLVDKTTTLTTDSLNYDRLSDLAWYWTGGKIQDSINVLTSRWGQYISHLNEAQFRGKVHLVNDKFVMDADTLRYNTETHVADILGPTTIVYEEETNIYSTRGWYNTENEKSELLQHSRIVHSDGTTMTGDTIFYDKRRGFGQVFHDIAITDSTDHLTLYGNYGEMYEEGTMGKNSGYVTDSALLVDWSDSVKYTYIHADTLFTEEIPYQAYNLRMKDSVLVDSVLTWQAPDTLWFDTTYRQIRAYYGVRIYREDMQAVSDSCIYNGRDSILSMSGKPIAWSDDQQVSAEHIDIYMKNQSVDYAHGIDNAMAVQQEHPLYYNQMTGKEIFAYVRDEELRQIDVNGNAETVFFPKEDDGAFIGVNKTQSSFVRIFIEDGKIDHVVFLQSPKGTLYPMNDLKPDQMKLGGFFWAEEERPTYPADVFRKAEKTERPGKVMTAVAEEDDDDSNSDKKVEKKTLNDNSRPKRNR